MSINFNTRMNPEEYAQQLATQNNISIEQARETLRTQYGEPSQENAPVLSSLTNDTFTSSTSKNNENSLTCLEDEDKNSKILDTILNLFKQIVTGNEIDAVVQNSNNSSMPFEMGAQQDPESYAQAYADENGLTLDEAKAELKAQHGDPQQDYNNIIETVIEETVEDVAVEEVEDAVIETVIEETVEEDTTVEEVEDATEETTETVEETVTEEDDDEDLPPSTPNGAPTAAVIQADNEILNYALQHQISPEEARKRLYKLYGNP